MPVQYCVGRGHFYVLPSWFVVQPDPLSVDVVKWPHIDGQEPWHVVTQFVKRLVFVPEPHCACCHVGTGTIWSVHYRSNPGSIPGYLTWDLWWTECPRDASLWAHCFPLCIAPVLHTHHPGPSKPVFLNRRAAARYRAQASIIPGRERFSCNLSF